MNEPRQIIKKHREQIMWSQSNLTAEQLLAQIHDRRQIACADGSTIKHESVELAEEAVDYWPVLGLFWCATTTRPETEDERTKREGRRIRRNMTKAQRTADDALKREARDRAEYERLKEKFNGTL